MAICRTSARQRSQDLNPAITPALPALTYDHGAAPIPACSCSSSTTAAYALTCVYTSQANAAPADSYAYTSVGPMGGYAYHSGECPTVGQYYYGSRLYESTGKDDARR